MCRLCLHCKEYARIKQGRTPDGALQRYKCKACNRLSVGVLEPKIESHCPHCDSINNQKIGFTKTTGYQRYRCKDCGKCYSDSPLPKGSVKKQYK